MMLRQIRNLWTLEEDVQLLELRRGGLSSSKIGEKLGRTRDQVQARVRLLRKRGVEVAHGECPPKAKSWKPWDKEEVRKLIKYKRAGLTHPVIALKLRRSKDSIEAKSGWLIRNGLI